MSSDIPWPYNINDPVKAVHFALDKDCPYNNPESCPDHHRARKFIQLYENWRTFHGGEDS